MKLIGCMGRKGSGKDTVAGLLMAEAPELDLGVCRFSGPLKRHCADLFPHVPWKHFFGTQAEKEADLAKYGLPGQTGRKILQVIGGAWRKVDPKIHIRLAREQEETPGLDGYIYTDVRFQNEVDAIHARGGVVVRLTRGDTTDTDVSETEQAHIPADYQIDNRNLTKGELKDRVKDLAWVLFGA